MKWQFFTREGGSSMIQRESAESLVRGLREKGLTPVQRLDVWELVSRALMGGPVPQDYGGAVSRAAAGLYQALLREPPEQREQAMNALAEWIMGLRVA